MEVYKFSRMTVTLISNNELVIEASTQFIKDGKIYRECFNRCFSLPCDSRTDYITSTLSADGVLVVIVPKGEFSNDKVHQTESTESEDDLSESETFSSKSSLEISNDVSYSMNTDTSSYVT